MDNVSVTGPGNPYLKIPAGSTGEKTDEAGWVAAETGTGTGTGVGAGGSAGATGRGGSFKVGVAIGWGAFLADFEKSNAVRDAPVAADVAAIMRKVALDMMKVLVKEGKWVTEVRPCGGRAESGVSSRKIRRKSKSQGYKFLAFRDRASAIPVARHCWLHHPIGESPLSRVGFSVMPPYAAR